MIRKEGAHAKSIHAKRRGGPMRASVTRSFALAGASAAALLCGLATSGPASAQSNADVYGTPPPIDNGAGTEAAIYNTSGLVGMSTTDLVIGSSSAGLALQRSFTGKSWRHNWIGMITDDTYGNFTVSAGAHSEVFKNTGTVAQPVFAPNTGTGDTLTYSQSTGLYTYVTKDGTIYIFNNAITTNTTQVNSQGGQIAANRPPSTSNDAQLTQITKPDGEIITLTYLYGTYTAALYTVDFYMNRLQSVVSNRGLMLHFNYLSDSPSTDGMEFTFLTKVTAINLSVDYCDPAATTCAGLTQSWPTVTYGSDGTGGVTDAMGNTTHYIGGGSTGNMYVTGGSVMGGIQYPGSTSNDVTFNYQTPQGDLLDQTLTSMVNANGTYSTVYSGASTVTITDPLGHTRSLSTNPGDNLTTSTVDGDNNQTTWTVSNYFGLPGSKTNPEGDGETYTYDSRGNLTSTVKTPKPGSGLASITTSATYPATCTYPASCNEPTTTTDALGNVTSYTYDNTTGLVLTKTLPADASGVQPQIRYSYAAVPTYAKNSSGAIVQTGTITQLASTSTCTSGAAPSCVGTAAEMVTTYSYANNAGTNYSGMLTKVVTSAGSGSWALNLATNYYYNILGTLSTVVDPRGNCVGYGYDLDRHKTIEAHYNTGCTAGWTSYTTYSYDALGRLIKTNRATGFDSNNNPTGWETTHASYNSLNEMVNTSDPLNNTTNYTYDAGGRRSTVTDPTGYVTQYQYDAADRKLQEQRAVGTSIQQNYATYTYSPNGQLLSETDARGNAIHYAYDGFDRLITTTYADNTTETAQYDPRGELTIATNRGGLGLVDCYDKLGRKVSEASINGATNQGACPTGGVLDNHWYVFPSRSFTYDLTGNLLTANTTAGWNHTYTYDNAGRLRTDVDGWQGTYTYGRDADGELVSLQYPGGQVVSYDYDALNRTSHAYLNGTTVATFAWDVLSRRTALTYGDGSSVAYGYDGDDRLTSQSHVFPNGTSANVAFTFGYDAASRLTSEGDNNSAYEYAPGAASTAYAAANTLNQYPSIAGVARSYTSTGALSGDTVLSRAYDQQDKFVSAVAVANSNSNVVINTDALGRTFARLHNMPTAVAGYPSGLLLTAYHTYAPDRPEVIADTLYTAPAGGGTNTLLGKRLYVLGPDPDERVAFVDTNSTVYYPHADRQGSTIGLSIGGQNVLTLAYDAYGQPSQTITDIAPGASAYPYLYTGQAYDPFLQAYDYKARVYSATDGRFWQTDPIGTGDGLNIYAYTHNSPLNGFDPTGLDCQSDNRSTTVKGPDGVDEITVTVGVSCSGPLSNAPSGGPLPGGNQSPPQPQNSPGQAAPSRTKDFCTSYAFKRNSTSFLLDGISFAAGAIPGGGVVAAGVGLTATSASMINSAASASNGASGAVGSIGIGIVGYHLTALAPAAAQLGELAVKAIPIAGMVAGGMSLAWDYYNYSQDVANCMAGKSL